MNAPLVFLDLDGVVNTRATQNTPSRLSRTPRRFPFDRPLVTRLNRLVGAGATLVISSDWRTIETLANLRVALVEAGLENGFGIIGMTPDLQSSAGCSRTATIYEYLVRCNRIPAGSIVALDDTLVPFVPQVLVDAEVGLTDANVDLALALLNLDLLSREPGHPGASL